MRSILLILTLLLSAEAFGQPSTEWQPAPLRSEFISYSLRETARHGDRDNERFYYRIDSIFTNEDGVYEAAVDIPASWIEREIFLHTEGSRNSHAVYVNDAPAGSARDSRLPSEFNLTRLLRRGTNTISIEIVTDTPEPESRLTDERPAIETAFLYSQPFTRIENFTLKASAEGMISVNIMTANSYRREESIIVGYDVFDAEGRLLHYDFRDVVLPAGGRDTLRLSAGIEGARNNLWSAGSPVLYDVMLFVRRNGIVVEYIPLKAGFGTTEYNNGRIVRNGRTIEAAAIRYNAAGPEQAATDISELKSRGIDTLCPDYPQPWWFYDLCDREGMYVIDRVNINSAHGPEDRTLGGTLSNNPAWLDEYIWRTTAAFTRSRHHPCIVGRSLGGDSGNGYNMYKTYLWLKAADPERPVIYDGAAGEWNSDLENLEIREFENLKMDFQPADGGTVRD